MACCFLLFCIFRHCCTSALFFYIISCVRN
nr:MAG TPA: hypothetical protein [Bacteriophage sp.]DAV16052.1 MAG TPA: hypothetical protein [Caudoviricetes sp.]